MPDAPAPGSDRDTLVPLGQSERFREAAGKAGATVKLIVRHGKEHAWWGMPWDIRRFADWFDEYLRTDR